MAKLFPLLLVAHAGMLLIAVCSPLWSAQQLIALIMSSVIIVLAVWHSPVVHRTAMTLWGIASAAVSCLYTLIFVYCRWS